MQAQRYRHRIEIQQKVELQDSETGEPSHTWETFGIYDKVPAEVLTGPGREFQAASTKQAEADYRVNCAWFSGLTQDMRIVWQSAVMDILSIETDATGRREYRLRCKAGVNNGG